MSRLLGSDVVEGADGGSLTSNSIIFGQVDRQPQVGELGCSITGHQDVVGVDVAVDQSFAVGVFEPHGDLAHELDGGRRGNHRLLGNQRADGLAFDVLHHEIIPAAGFAEVVDAHQILVLQLGAYTCLTLKSRNGSRVVDPLGRENLRARLDGSIACPEPGKHVPFLPGQLSPGVRNDRL